MPKKTGKTARCPQEEEIPGYLLGETTDQRLKMHFRRCPRCCNLLGEMRATLKEMRQPPVALQRDLAPQILAIIDRQHKVGKPRSIVRNTLASLALLLVLLCIVSLIFVAKNDHKSRYPLERIDPETSEKHEKSAIADALDWLAKNQGSDGSWAAEKWGGKKEHTVALTGLALLAFCSDANGSYGQTTSRAADYIITQQNSDGLFGPGIDKALYNHGIATLALLSLHRTGKKNNRMRRAIQRALDYICNMQEPSGGWGYLTSGQGNTSITVWQLQSSLVAVSHGWRYPKNSIDIGLSWLRRNVDDQGYVGYRQANDFPYGSETSTAIATLVLIGDEKMKTSEKKRLKRALKSLSDNTSEIDYYRWYFLGEALRISQANGLWKDRARKTLGAKQIKEGTFQGSWNPDDRWGKIGGRIYSTALAILVLQSL